MDQQSLNSNGRCIHTLYIYRFYSHRGPDNGPTSKLSFSSTFASSAILAPGEKKDASMADLAKHAVRVETLTRTIPETKMAPARKPSQKETIVLQHFQVLG